MTAYAIGEVNIDGAVRFRDFCLNDALDGRGYFDAFRVLLAAGGADNLTILVMTAHLVSIVSYGKKNEEKNESGKMVSTNHEHRMMPMLLLISNPHFIIHHPLKRVTRGYNIVVNGWARVSDPHPHPTSLLSPPFTHI